MMFSLKSHNGARGPSAVAIGRAGAVRQVDKQILDFGRPILCKGEFKPGANRPSGFDCAVEGGWGIEAGLNITEGGSTRASRNH
jgi:hypothetical protein